MPNDALFAAAQKGEPEILEYAMSKCIALATPATLYALLMTVRLGWNENKLAENAKEIAELGGKLAKGIGAWLENIQKTGQSLKSAVDSYNKSIGSFDKNVIPNIKKLTECGIQDAAEINTDLNTIDESVRESRHQELLEKPNQTTIAAINEVEDMEKQPESHTSYHTVDEAIKDLLV